MTRQRQGGRPNEQQQQRGDRQGERLDNRRQNDERPASRGGRGGRQRLSSKEKDRVSCALCVRLCV